MSPGSLVDDPFPFIFHRRSPHFETTRIRIDGLAAGTWAPQGIGSFRWLKAFTYDTVLTAYDHQELKSLMISIGKLRRQVGRRSTSRAKILTNKVLTAMPDDFSKLSEQQLMNILHDSPIATPVSARAGAAIGELMRRLGGRVLAT